MPKAVVAYEARRRRPALPILRWHRVGEQIYRAEKDGKSFTVFHRSPDRRHGKLPWVLTSGGVRGAEIKSFDTAADAKEYARCVNSGAGGVTTKVIVQAAPGMPAGTYKGTMAGEAKRTPYFDAVEQALWKMDAGGLGSESSSYVASMEAAGIDPSIVASVLVATHGHRHDHNCVGKHVELAEGGAAEGRREDLVFRGQRAALFDLGGSWGYSVGNGDVVEGFVSRDAAKAAAMQAMGMPAGFSMAVEEGGSKRLQAARAVLSSFGYSITKTDFGDYRVFKKGETDPEKGYYTDDLDDAVATGQQMALGTHAGEAKKRLPQPDPSTGLWLTHSSATQDTFLMHGRRLVDRFKTRQEALDFAKKYVTTNGYLDEASDFTMGVGTEESRRPKG